MRKDKLEGFLVPSAIQIMEAYVPPTAREEQLEDHRLLRRQDKHWEAAHQPSDKETSIEARYAI
jgi:hypothetical protein